MTLINTKDITFKDQEVSDCVDESMKKIKQLESQPYSPEVQETIDEEKEAIELMLSWVDLH